MERRWKVFRFEVDNPQNVVLIREGLEGRQTAEWYLIGYMAALIDCGWDQSEVDVLSNPAREGWAFSIESYHVKVCPGCYCVVKLTEIAEGRDLCLECVAAERAGNVWPVR